MCTTQHRIKPILSSIITYQKHLGDCFPTLSLWYDDTVRFSQPPTNVSFLGALLYWVLCWYLVQIAFTCFCLFPHLFSLVLCMKFQICDQTDHYWYSLKLPSLSPWVSGFPWNMHTCSNFDIHQPPLKFFQFIKFSSLYSCYNPLVLYFCCSEWNQPL